MGIMTDGKKLVFGLPAGKPLNPPPDPGFCWDLLHRSKYVVDCGPGTEGAPLMRNDPEIDCVLLQDSPAMVPDILIERGPAIERLKELFGEEITPLITDLGYAPAEGPTGLWLSQHTKADPWRNEKALTVSDMVKGGRTGTLELPVDLERWYFVTFNVAKEREEEVSARLYFGAGDGRGWFGKGPTELHILDAKSDESKEFCARQIAIQLKDYPLLVSALRKIKTFVGRYAVTDIGAIPASHYIQ
jgi:hypothetical protein